jgi:hypothetical protein
MESTMTKPLTLKRPKPRNPLALAGRLRSAGVHRSPRQVDRQSARRELQSELKQWHAPPP